MNERMNECVKKAVLAEVDQLAAVGNGALKGEKPRPLEWEGCSGPSGSVDIPGKSGYLGRFPPEDMQTGSQQ